MDFNKHYFLVILLVTIVACNEQSEPHFVQSVYPTSDILPENLLRMYVTFSRPMKTLNNLEKIKLIDKNGDVVENVFFNNVYELWDTEQKQLTLLLDPSRVKTGLKANIRLGQALSSGNTYQLVIEGLEDVNHQKMKSSFIKEFTVTEADLTPPDIGTWALVLPKPKTEKALVIKFPNMLDYFSLHQRLVVTNAEKNVVEGKVHIGKQEKEWLFIPDSVWKEGDYFLYVNTRLEDPSGNNLNGLFDHKVGTLNYEKEGKTINIPFKIN